LQGKESLAERLVAPSSVRYQTNLFRLLLFRRDRAHSGDMKGTSSRPCCLLAEDQALIAMDLEADLEEVGIEVVGPFASCAEVLSWVEHDTPEMALLDFELRDGPCTELARTLLGRGVPVVIYSGIPRGPDILPDLRDVIWIEKPVDRADLLQVLIRFVPEQSRFAASSIS
jgi:DNA-binding NtrC family response regulator